MANERKTDVSVFDVCVHAEDIREPDDDVRWCLEWRNDNYGVTLAVVDGSEAYGGGVWVLDRFDIRKGGWRGGGVRMRTAAAYGKYIGNTRACTLGCWRERTAVDSCRRRCVLVVVNDLEMGVGSVAHEAGHCADLICDMHGVRYGMFELGEAHAYLAGWCAKYIAVALRRFARGKGIVLNSEQNSVAIESVDAAYLYDWYISSVDDNPPHWTEEHINELCKDFYLIPKKGGSK